MAPHSVLLPGKSHGWRSLVGCSLWGCEELDTIEQLHFHFSLSCIGGGNGNPLQCSCLENPGTGEPDGLSSTGSHRVEHDWSDLAAMSDLKKNMNYTILLAKLLSIFWPDLPADGRGHLRLRMSITSDDSSLSCALPSPSLHWLLEQLERLMIHWCTALAYSAVLHSLQSRAL